MEWNTQPPIQFSVLETLQDASYYDCIVIGIIEDSAATNITGDSGRDSGSDTLPKPLDSLGAIFHAVDNKYTGILSKWMEGKDDMSVSASSSTITFTSPKGRMSLDAKHQKKRKKRKSEDWDELSKVCKVSLDGHMEVQRLVVCRIRGDPTSSKDAGKLGRSIGTLVASHLKTEGERWAFLMPPPTDNSQGESPLFGDFVSEMTTSLWSTLYKDHRFKSSPKNKLNLSQLQEAPVALDLIWDHPPGKDAPATPFAFVKQARQSIAKGEIIASGVSLAKDIVNAPHNVLNSISLAETARRLAFEYPRLTCNVLNVEDCERQEMGAYLGVARGSETPPQFIHLIYRPRRRSRRLL
jgi:leucyl aminopeptidase